MPNNEGFLPIHYACKQNTYVGIVLMLLAVYPEGAHVQNGDESLHTSQIWHAAISLCVPKSQIIDRNIDALY